MAEASTGLGDQNLVMEATSAGLGLAVGLGVGVGVGVGRPTTQMSFLIHRGNWLLRPGALLLPPPPSGPGSTSARDTS